MAQTDARERLLGLAPWRAAICAGAVAAGLAWLLALSSERCLLAGLVVGCATGWAAAARRSRPEASPADTSTPARAGAFEELSEGALEELSEGALDAFWTMDAAGRVTYMSPSIGRLLGYTPEDRVGNEIAQTSLTPASAEAAQRHLGAALEGKLDEVVFEVQHVRKDGSLLWCEISAAVHRDERGRVEAIHGVTRDISARKRAEEALRENERRLHALSTRVRDLLVELDVEGRVTFVSPTSERIVGWRAEEIEGKRLVDLFTRDTRDRALERFEAGLRGEIDEASYQVAQVHRDGHRVWLEVNAAASRNDDGSLAGVHAVVRDVSDRKRMEEALAASERRLRELSERVVDVLWTMDPGGAFTYLSDSVERMFGLPASAIVGHRVDEAELLGDSTEVLQRALARLRSGASDEETFTLAMNAADGRTAWYEISGVASRDETGQLVAIHGVTRDVTDRRAAEEALRASEERFQNLSQQVNDVLWTLGPDGRMTYVSPSLERLLGYKPAEHVGEELTLIALSPEAARHAVELVEGARRGELDSVVFEADHIHRDGSKVWCEVSARAHRDAAGNLVAVHGVTRDVTERRIAEQRLREQTERLRERSIELASVNAELDAFASTVSHDLRAPLRQIEGFARALDEESEGSLDAAAREHLSRIRAAAERMGELMESLLHLSRTSQARLRPQPVDLSQMAEEIGKQLALESGPPAVALQVEPGLRARGDRSLLQMALENLLRNAWKFTREEPSPRVEVKAAGGPPGRLTLVVRDNGIGFDSEEVGEELFRPFKRMHGQARYPGHGVGLAIVERVARRHGGRAWAEARPGHGASFFLDLERISEESDRPS